MAYSKKRTSRAKKSRSNPIQNQINLVLDGSADTEAILRCDRVLSQMNHQLFRQSRNYCVKLDLDIAAANDTVIDVYTLVDTWWLKKAYNLAYETFVKNSSEESGQLKSMKARWNDFRVDHGLASPAFDKQLIACGYSTPGTEDTYASNQEYRMSEVHNTLGQTNTFRFIGSGTGTWNIIDQYDLTGNTQSTPSIPTTEVAYDGLEDTLDDGQMDHLSGDGNVPPYDSINFENGVLVRVATLANFVTGPKLSTGYFNAPAGLVVVQSRSNNLLPSDVMLTMTAKEGNYKGIHAPSMLE